MKQHTKGANGKPCQRLGKGHECSCCGTRDDDNEWFVYRAGWCDEDGVYYSKLCGDGYGNGCIYEVEPANTNKNEAAQTLLEIMPDEADDGVPAMLDDLEYLFGEDMI